MRIALLCIVLAGCQAVSASEPPDAGALYNRYCLPCHGVGGGGNGPAAAWLWPRPRDFSKGEFKWRSTASGSAPTTGDLVAAIREGVPGTSMHSFGPSLTGEQIAALAETVKAFAPERFAKPAAVVELSAAPAVDDALIARGKAKYTELGCNTCHGDGGKGDGEAAEGLEPRPYDLTALPIRRPGGASIEGIHASLVTGLDGTPMPSYVEAAPDADLWAVAAFVDSIRYTSGPLPNPTISDVDAVYALTPDDLAAGYWPGDPASPDAIVWGGEIDVHRDAPANLTPAQSSLQPAQCGRCHAKQLREWRESLHAKTSSPGTLGQVMRKKPAGKKSCMRCHAPLPEQLDTGKPYDEELRNEGLACATCHLRNWTRLGPPIIPENKLLGQSGYPFQELAIYERADFCLPCHQLPAWNVKLIEESKEDPDKRKPLLNTYREWLEGPYMRRGIQCQHCHMPNREHTFLGVHDPETFRQGIKLEAIAGRSTQSGTVSVRARLTNVGAGHYLPTTPTPAAFLDIELIDAGEHVIDGASATLRIGRNMEYPSKNDKFIQVEDTRIPPDESIELARGWADGRVADAKWARVRVRVEPDEYYVRLFKLRLAGELPDEVRAYFEEALAIKQASAYVALERNILLRPF